MPERGGPVLVLEAGEGQRHQERPEEERAERGVREHDQDVVVRAVREQDDERAEQQRRERQGQTERHGDRQGQGPARPAAREPRA